MNRLSTLLSRLVWLSLLPPLLLACGLAAYHIHSGQVAMREAAGRRLGNYSAQIDSFLEMRILALGMLADSPLADDPKHWPELYAQAQTFRASFGGHVIFADTERQMLFNTRVPFGTWLPRLPEARKGRSAEPLALETSQPAVGDIVQGPLNDEALVAIAVPGLRAGRVRHLMLITTSTSELQRRVDAIPVAPGWALSAQDGAGNLIARQAPPGFDPAHNVDTDWHFAKKSRFAPWTITVEVPRAVIHQPLLSSMAALLLAIVLTTLAGRILGRRVAHRIERQITALDHAGPDAPPVDIVEITAVRERLDANLMTLRESEARYHSLFDNSHAAMLLIDPDGGSIVAANPAAAAFYGWPQEQLLGMRIDQINVLPPANSAAEMQQAPAQQRNRFEFRHRLADGQMRDVEVFSDPVQVGGKSLLYCIVHDISGRMQTARELAESEARRQGEMSATLEAQHQGRLAALNLMDDAVAAHDRAETALSAQIRLSQLYATLSQSNLAIVHCDSEATLFPQICREAINFGGLKMAWIGLVDETGQKVMPVASFGDASDYLASAPISMDAGHPHGQGPTATAIRENQPVWCQDFLHDPRTTPWHERGARAVWMASASLPLRREGVTVGALTLYANEANFFDDAIQKLLIEMAADISFAMDGYAAIAERDRAVAKMAEQLDELRRWQQVMLGREDRIMAMKKEVNSLLAGQGQPPRYASAVDEEQTK